MGRFALICLAIALAAQCLHAETATASELEYGINIPESAVVHVTVPGLESSHAQDSETEEEGDSEAGAMTERALRHSCYVGSYGRGAGYPLTSCNPDEHKSGLVCYPQCRSGFTGSAFVCWANCPSGFHDIGMFCQKPRAYGRGPGYVLWKQGKCNREHSEGCERHGGIYYPRCRSGFHAVGCCICTPNCPSGMRDTGTGCAKQSYTRGAGHILRCRPGLEQNGLLCYPPCKSGYKGIGPVCWRICPAGTTQCGVFCLVGDTCPSKIANTVQSVVNLSLNAASVIPGAQALKGAKMAMKAAKKKCGGGKAAAKAAKTAAKEAMKEALKQGGKKLEKEAIKKGMEVHKGASKGVAHSLSPKVIATAVIQTVVSIHNHGREIIVKKCIE